MSTQSMALVRFSGRQKAGAGPPRVPDLVPAPDRQALFGTDREFIGLILASGGHDIVDYRAEPLRRRLPAVLRSLRVPSVQQGLTELRCNPQAFEKALCALLISHTASFRDEAVFQTLRDPVLPELLARVGAPRILSIACSNGAELYSIALLLAAAGLLEQSELCGIDGRRAAIQEASQLGTTFWSSVPAAFEDLKSSVSQSDFLRMTERILWRTQSVLETQKHEVWDLVLCRNLSIYLQPLAALRLWQLAGDSLTPDGILVTGKAEHPLPVERWRRIDKCIYQLVKE